MTVPNLQDDYAQRFTVQDILRDRLSQNFGSEFYRPRTDYRVTKDGSVTVKFNVNNAGFLNVGDTGYNSNRATVSAMKDHIVSVFGLEQFHGKLSTSIHKDDTAIVIIPKEAFTTIIVKDAALKQEAAQKAAAERAAAERVAAQKAAARVVLSETVARDLNVTSNSLETVSSRRASPTPENEGSNDGNLTVVGPNSAKFAGKRKFDPAAIAGRESPAKKGGYVAAVSAGVAKEIS